MKGVWAASKFPCEHRENCRQTRWWNSPYYAQPWAIAIQMLN